MSLPPWLEIVQDLSQRYPQEHTQVLATMTEKGLPCSRYIGHRRIHLSNFNSSTPFFISTTDVRTPKATHLSLHPQCNIIWWLPTPNVQFRMDGTARTIGQDQSVAVEGGKSEEGEAEDWEKMRQEIWRTIRPDMKAGFVRPVAPGVEIGSYEEMDRWVDSVPQFEDAKDEEERQTCLLAYRNFCLVIFKPTAVDFVELNAVPNRRTAWKLDGTEWKKWILCP